MVDVKIILDKKMEIFNNYYNKFKDDNEVNEIELKESLFDVLSWFEICLNHVNVKKLSTKEQQIISAIRYANNKKKHSAQIFNYTLSTKALYTSDDLYPSPDLFSSSFSVFWNDLPLEDSKFKPQYNRYNSILKGKDLYTSLNEIYHIINSYFSVDTKKITTNVFQK